MSDREDRITLTRTLTLTDGQQAVTNTASVDIDLSYGENPTALIVDGLGILAAHLGQTPEAAGPDVRPSRDASPAGVVRGSTDGTTPRA